MDNMQQIEAILKYKRHLTRLFRREIDENAAAMLWIEKYAKMWRFRKACQDIDPSVAQHSPSL